MSTAEQLGSNPGSPLTGSPTGSATLRATTTPTAAARTAATALAAGSRSGPTVVPDATNVPWTTRHRRFRSATLLIAADAVAFFASVLIAGDLRPTTAITAALTVVLLAAGGLYQHRLSLSVLDDLPAIVGRVLAAAALAAMYRELASSQVILAPRLRLMIVSVLLVLLARTIAYAVIRWARVTRRSSYRTLVVGAGKIGQEVATLLADHPQHGLEPIGFYDPEPIMHPAPALTVFSSQRDLADIVTRLRVQVVIVAFSGAGEEAIVDAVRTCGRLDCEIFMVPRLFELQAPSSRHVDRIWSMKVIRLGRNAHRSMAWPIKRLIDIVVAGTGLLVLSPLLALIALAVWLDSRCKGSVLFHQERIGIDNRPFTIFKFRSMRPATSAEAATKWNIARDNRVRPLGRILRGTSLDELPQLWNVLRGDMSLVGPRPERPHFVGLFSQEYPDYPARHRVPSGLTGWAQVHGLRGDTSIRERARFDNDYIEHWSLWNDVKIILRTATATLLRRGS